MTQSIRLAAISSFLSILAYPLSGQTVTTSATEPTVRIIDSFPTGGIDTALIDEETNANHSRGQIFSLPDGDGTDFQLTAITIKKSNTQTYLNDILTLNIFEGTVDQWTTGTGHETAVDGTNYLVDTTVTLLHTEAFTLNGEFVNNDYVTFELATPISVNENSDFGFFMTYDRSDPANPDRFRHRENGTGGGRLSITTTAHGSTSEGSRKVVYFIHGSSPDSGIINPTIQTSEDLIEAGGSVDLTVTFDTTADTASLSTSAGAVDLLALDADDASPGDGSVIVSDSPTSTFTYEVLLTKTGEVDESISAQVLVANPSSEAADNAFSSVLKADSPLFYYRFEDSPEAGFLYDSSGNSHHILNSGITGSLGLGDSPGGMQNAGQFSNSSILVPATSNMGASFTATAIVNVNDLQAGVIDGIFSMTDGNLTGRSILFANIGQIQSFISGGTLANPGGTVPPNQTSCILHFVSDADPDADPGTDDQEIRFYINGVLQGGAGVPTGAIDANIGNWVLGSHKTRTTQYLQGWMDEAAVFESALTGPQIAAHATAFFAAADPLLGYVADLSTVDWGNPVTLTWKISDQATAVTINGTPQTIDGGGVYTTIVNATADTTYSLEVTGPGGPFVKAVDVTVVGGPPAPPKIISISTDGANPPNITLEITGEPNTTYLINASGDLSDGFPFEMTDNALTDESGLLTITFPTVSQVRFFRVESPAVAEIP